MPIQYFLSHPMYGQEGGGVAYTDWKPTSEKSFWLGCEQLLANAHRSRLRATLNDKPYTIMADAFADSAKVVILVREGCDFVENPVGTLADIKNFLAEKSSLTQ